MGTYVETFVYDAAGCLLNPGRTYTNYLRLGLFPITKVAVRKDLAS